jgi:hypothetical protein
MTSSRCGMGRGGRLALHDCMMAAPSCRQRSAKSYRVCVDGPWRSVEVDGRDTATGAAERSGLGSGSFGGESSGNMGRRSGHWAWACGGASVTVMLGGWLCGSEVRGGHPEHPGHPSWTSLGRLRGNEKRLNWGVSWSAPAIVWRRCIWSQ